MRPITKRLQGRLDRQVVSDPTALLEDALAEIERLRGALEWIIVVDTAHLRGSWFDAVDAARAALKEKKP